MDNPATWIILVCAMIWFIAKLISAMPDKNTHAYDKYNAKIDKARKGYWI